MDSAFSCWQPIPLHRCQNCHKAAGPEQKLRRCGGCHDGPAYCSKECQKAQWPYHKTACRDFSNKNFNTVFGDGRPPPGYTSTSELTKAMNDFVQTHAWALETAAKTLALGVFGLDYLNHASDGISRFVFESNATADGPRRNPARSFKLVDLKLVGIETWCENGQTKAEVAEMLAENRRTAIGHFTRQIPDRPPKGVLQVAYQIRGERATHWQCFPQYQLPSPIPPPPLKGPEIAESFRDLITLCTASVNGGYPFRWLRGRGPFAYPGRYTHTKHQWTWEPLFTNWEDHRQGPANYPTLTALNDLRSGQTPDQLMWLISLFNC
ncbi:hypothetical protein K466DRAFT_530815 [Polyporus arcularius HHB13444]|uniref:MYND-type domain-containing protein n=1 Tax=Polyporus arcularius HHB13444 TaxID=1314778 RepID=A0A5C3NYH4_9APHY|nr:hypothetical protein K466DRAFT_530815 [Polyporus arcularius HHB13444]